MPDPLPSSPSKVWSPDYPFSPKRSPFFYGWVVVAIATLGIVFSIPGQTMGFSVFTDILIEKLGLTRVQLSTAYCVGTVISGITLPWLGRWFDRIGARKMLVASALATGVVLFYLSVTHHLVEWGSKVLPGLSRTAWAFGLITLGFYMIRAAAQGVLTMTCRNAIGKWFDHRRGIALSVSGVFVSFSFAVAPVALSVLIDRFHWWGAWQIMGVASILVLAVLGWAFLRDNPEECGLVMDGDANAGGGQERHADTIAHRDYDRREALGTLAFWAFNLSFGFWSLFATASTFHIISLGAEFGRSKEEIIRYFIPMAVLSVLTNLFCGFISARIRLKWLLVLMNAAALLGVLATLKLDTGFGLVGYIIGYGICGGCFAALSGIVWPRFFGRQHLGAIAGVGMSSMVIASGIGPMLFALSKSWSGSYAPSLWLSAAVPAALLLMSFWADNPQRREG